MTYDLSKFENKYQIKLDDTQKSVLSSLINFIENDNEQRITVSGRPGSGKTIILKILYYILEDNGYYTCCVTPTNKARSVFDSDINTLTIHSLLNLKPDLDILEFDANNLQFDLFENPKHTYDYDVLILDECSMINSSLYNILLEKFKKAKLIFCGDPKQLACIEDGKLSKTFNNKQLVLDVVYRQSEGIVSKVISYLRNKSINKFKSISTDDSNIIVFNDINVMLDKYYYLFKLISDFQVSNLCKLITFSNNRINALNNIIRSKLYNDTEEYHEREILTAYDTYRQYNVVYLENSVDYLVLKYKPCLIKNKYPGYKLTVVDSYNQPISFCILSRNISQYLLNELAETLENLRLKAVKSKSKLDWQKFYTLYESFATPIDLIHDGRVIKRKTIDYGYCISTYKSQGSSYNIVMIDMENIQRFASGEKLRQLQYVACSRTMSDLIIYQKD